MSDVETLDGVADADNDRTMQDPVKQSLVKQRDSLKSEVRELRAFKAKQEEAAELARQEALQKREQWETLTNELKGKHSKELEKERKELAKLRADYDGLVKSTRFNSFASALADKLGNRTVVEALMLKAERDGGLDIAPEQVTADVVDATADVIRQMAPELFVNKGNGAGGGSAVPGFNPLNKSPGEVDDREARREKYRAMGKAHSDALYRPAK